MVRKYMNRANDKKKIMLESLLIFILMVFVFLISVNHINESNGIKVYGDEMGYWENAALLTGRDWSGEASLNIYYGYGYGFLLTPILLLCNKNSTDMMHAAIILQGIMLSTCILASWLISKKVNSNVDWKCRIVITLFSVLYAPNIFYVKFTLSETLLTTCIWWISYLVLCYTENHKSIQGIGIIILSFYMFSVHQRMITMVLTGFMLVLFVSFLNSSKNKFKMLKILLFLFLLTAVCYYFCKSYDSFYTNSVYKLAVDGGKETNRVDVAAKKALSSLVSFYGCLTLLISFCGKIFYSFVATYGFILVGGYSCLYFAMKYIKDKEQNYRATWYMYIFLNYLASIGVSSLAMRGGYELRSDFLLYGRYSEYTYGPILLVGLLYLYKFKRNESKKLFCGMIIILVLCLICIRNTFNDAPNSHFWVMCSAMGDIRAVPDISNKEVVLVTMLRCICILGFLVIIENIFNKFKRRFYNIVLVIVIISWIHTANVNWDKNVLPWYTPFENAMSDIVANMEHEDEFITLDVELAGCMQFFLPNVAMKPCTDIKEVLNYEKGTYVITGVSSEYASYIREHYTVDKENDRYMRWRYE